MRHIHGILFWTLCSIVVLASSCGKEDTDKNTQESYISSIASSLQSADSTVTVTQYKGATRVTVVHGSGDSLSSKGMVSFYYAGYTLTSSSISSSNLFATNNKELAESLSWNLSDTTVFTAVTVDMSKDDLLKGLKNGLVGVQTGEECYIMFNEDYGFGKKTVGNIPENSALAYHLWIVGVANN